MKELIDLAVRQYIQSISKRAEVTTEYKNKILECLYSPAKLKRVKDLQKCEYTGNPISTLVIQ